MNVLSLFDGMSCGQIALERAGIKVNNYFASEIDKHAIKITQANYPDTIQLGDVRDVQGVGCDLLIGGSPCQSFSRSGDGSGFDGKSGLFFEYVRILKQTNPSYFLLENVVMKKEWEDIISENLGVDPIMIDSKLVSAQKRQRLYWTNIPNATQPEDKNINIRDIIQLTETPIPYSDDFIWFKDGEYRVINATKKGYITLNDYDVVNLDFPKSKTRRGRVSVGKSNTLNTTCNQAVWLNGYLYKLTTLDCRRLQTIPDHIDMSMVSESKAKNIIGNGWTVDVIAHIFKNIK